MFNELEFRGLLAKNGLTIEKTAELLGISPPMLYRKMTGESDFYRKGIQRICEITGEKNLDYVFLPKNLHIRKFTINQKGGAEMKNDQSIKVKIEVDKTDLDEALKKATQLVALLQEAKELIGSLRAEKARFSASPSAELFNL